MSSCLASQKKEEEKDKMCAKKKAKFWLTIWLSFEIRKIFLETVLQMLLICVCHFSCSSTVTPSRRCFETCSTGVVSQLDLRRAVVVGVSVSSPSTCILFWLDSAPSDFYNTIQRYHLNFTTYIYIAVSCIKGVIIRK